MGLSAVDGNSSIRFDVIDNDVNDAENNLIVSGWSQLKIILIHLRSNVSLVLRLQICIQITNSSMEKLLRASFINLPFAQKQEV